MGLLGKKKKGTTDTEKLKYLYLNNIHFVFDGKVYEICIEEDPIWRAKLGIVLKEEC